MLKIALSYCILFRPDCLSSLGGLLFSERKGRESGPGGGGGRCWDETREGETVIMMDCMKEDCILIKIKNNNLFTAQP